MRGDEHRSKAARRPVRVRAARGPLNEVVCGAMMLAYERAGKWNEVCHIDSRCLHVTALLMGLPVVHQCGHYCSMWYSSKREPMSNPRSLCGGKPSQHLLLLGSACCWRKLRMSQPCYGRGWGKDTHACMFVRLALSDFVIVQFILSLDTEPVSCSLLAAATHCIFAC